MSHDSHHVVPYGVHIKVWGALLVLTALTVMLAGRIHLGVWSGVIAFAIASTKAVLVLAYFMHLKYESKMFPIMFGVAVFTLLVIFGLTASDYLYR